MTEYEKMVYKIKMASDKKLAEQDAKILRVKRKIK